MKQFSLFILLALLFTGCAYVTGPAEDPWDREEKRNADDKIQLGKIFKGKKSKQKDENAELKRRIEQLERQQGTAQPAANTTALPTNTTSSDITAPPAIGAKKIVRHPAMQNPENTISYQEWLRAKQSNNAEYQEFKEYQDWLEFKKQQRRKQQ